MTRTSGRNRHFWLAGKREPAQDLFFREALDPSVWAEGSSDLWSTCWYTGMPAPEVFEQLGPGCSINHIPGNNGLTVKSNLYATLARGRERIAAQAGPESARARRMDFFPHTFMMPNDYAALQDAAADNPEKRWILKPRNSARGKGISLVHDPADVPRDKSFMVQEYVDKPHTIDGHKYVLRLYVLITSVEPLRVYLYQEGSAKLASERYDPDNPDNIYAHLTNPDVNATNTASQRPVVFISFANYRAWLREQGHDDAALFERIRDMLTLTVISVREHMRSRLARIKAPTTGCYELLGIDCLVDANLKPHILECNLSPSLDVCAAPEDGGDVEARNKRQLVTDMVKLLGLNAPPQGNADLEPTERILEKARTELERAGGFHRLYPAEDVARYLPYFPYPRLADMVLADTASGAPVPRPRIRARDVAEIIDDNGLALYSERTGTLYRPNGTAGWIWLMATDGMPADTIAEHLLEASDRPGDPERAWELRQQVWDTLADWGRDGLLLQEDSEPTSDAGDVAALGAAAGRATRIQQTGQAPEELTVSAGGIQVVLSTGCAAVARRVLPAFAPLSVPGDTQASRDRLQIVSTRGGYAVTDSRLLIGQDLGLGDVASMVADILLRRAVAQSAALGLHAVLLSLAGSDQPREPSCSALVIPGAGATPHDRDRLAASLAQSPGSRLAGGVLLDTGPQYPVQALGLPCMARDRAPDNPGTQLGHRPWRLLPAGADLIALPQDVPVVLVEAPPGSSDSSVTTAITPLTAGQALARILPWCVGPGADTLPAASVSALYGWLDARAIYAVEPGPAGTAAARALLEEVAGQTGETVVTGEVG